MNFMFVLQRINTAQFLTQLFQAIRVMSDVLVVIFYSTS